jgi:transcription-repair coupling factor (superfamily II helicase)
MLKNLLSSATFGGIYNKIKDDVCGGIPTAVFGVSFAEKCRVVSGFDGQVLYIVRDMITAKKVQEEISQITGEECIYLPASDDMLLYKADFDKENLFKRLTALYKIQNGAKKIVTTFEALMGLMPQKIDSLEFKKDEDYDLSSISEKLVKLGYIRVEVCESAGTFSLRGDSLVVYPINEDKPVRLDFFGDTLERIR